MKADEKGRRASGSERVMQLMSGKAEAQHELEATSCMAQREDGGIVSPVIARGQPIEGVDNQRAEQVRRARLRRAMIRKAIVTEKAIAEAVADSATTDELVALDRELGSGDLRNGCAIRASLSKAVLGRLIERYRVDRFGHADRVVH
ncbi:MAG: hypothetical protein WAW96_20600 [Alphaproteobacteria bacterium]